MIDSTEHNYGQLRKLIDGASESMTHEDAVQELKDMERMARLGQYVIDFATKMKWSPADGEGAFEFIQRHSYVVGIQDAGGKLPDGYDEKRWPITALAGSDGWKEAVVAWMVCGSIHHKFGKGRDAFYSTRQGDFVRHEANARAIFNGVAGDVWHPARCLPPDHRQVLVELVHKGRKKKNHEPELKVGCYFRPLKGVHDGEPGWAGNDGEDLNVVRWRYI